jgi:hypothetical protein
VLAGDTKDLGIQQFVKDPSKFESLQNLDTPASFKQFQNIQAGRGIDENLLALRQQQAAKESGDYLQAAQAAQQQLGSEGGRFDLLRKTFGGAARPGYSTGQQRLDQALLSQQGLGGLRSDISQDLRSATEAQRQAQQAAGEVSSLASQERGIVGGISDLTGGIQTGYESLLGNQLEELKTLHPEAQREIEQKLSTGALSQSDIENLGLTAGTQLFDLNLQDYLTKSIEPTMETSMTPEQLARYKAVQDLSGLSGTYQGLDESLAGTYKPYGYDVEGFQKDFSKSQTEFQNKSREAADALSAFSQYYAPRLNKDLTNWGKDPLFGNIPKEIRSRQDVESVQNLINRLQTEFGGKTLGGGSGGRLGFDDWSQVSGNVGGQHSRTYEAEDLAAREGYRNLLKALPRLQELQTGRRLEPQADLETGGNFNVK